MPGAVRRAIAVAPITLQATVLLGMALVAGCLRGTLDEMRSRGPGGTLEDTCIEDASCAGECEPSPPVPFDRIVLVHKAAPRAVEPCPEHAPDLGYQGFSNGMVVRECVMSPHDRRGCERHETCVPLAPEGFSLCVYLVGEAAGYACPEAYPERTVARAARADDCAGVARGNARDGDAGRCDHVAGDPSHPPEPAGVVTFCCGPRASPPE